MTQNEKYAINIVIENVKKLASLGETCGLPQEVKDRIRPYMSWFESDMFYLSKLVEADGSYETKTAIKDIERYCY